MAGISYKERVFVGGPTRSGKSEVVNLLFSGVRCQRLLLDTKGGEWAIEGVEPTFEVPAIDWTQPIIHYVTQTTDVGEIDELFRVCEKRRNLLIAVHELGDLCEHSTNKTPASVNRYLSQGGAWGRGLFGASQMPVDMPKRAKTEAQHVLLVAPPMAEEHLEVIAKMVERTSAAELKAELEAAQRDHGDHSFIHFTRGAGDPTIWPPLPESLRSKIIVTRAAGVS